MGKEKESRAKEYYSVLVRPKSWPKNSKLESAFFQSFTGWRKKHGSRSPSVMRFFEQVNYFVHGNNDLHTDISWAREKSKVANAQARLSKRLGRPLTPDEEAKLKSSIT